ncbi:MAG TPA: glycosyl hydrolase [Thermoanaerobaculia bacterium]|nr:glycosyl hydrolase [Thermoanaerobaculia bacterium]
MHWKPKRLLCLAAAVGLAAASGAARAAEVEIDSNTFGGLEARSIGPAVMGGRIAAIDAVAQDPLTIYVGAAGGGVWKSTDGGLAWKPVFDDHAQSIGAIAIDPKAPKTVWVGTGESWTRNSVSVGDGLYKTTDGGDSWQRVGLENTERIARIQVSPQDGNTVWACATGHLWGSHEDRGVYKTTDGGKTWKKVLYVDADTGCSDLSVDPQDPSIVFAGMWQFRRNPWSFHSGGKGSGLYKSTDGGDTWRQLETGLPAGEKGRVAVAVAPSRASVVYALVEAEETALYRSDDVGESWRQVNTSFNMQVRPFYFAHIVVDPTDFNTVYKPGLMLTVSTDGGKTFNAAISLSNFGAGPHSDHHALWVNARNPNEILLGTDGGVYMSYNKGVQWRHLKTLPVSQFYHVSYDMSRPYRVFGGLQDNGSWAAPSAGLGGSIQNKDWVNVGGGDGFWAFTDPADSDLIYVEYQGGEISRRRISTGEEKIIKPLPGADEPPYRFNWNTPVHVSPNEPGTLYMGGQFLFRSRDRGDSWQRISPDLTTNDPKKQQQIKSGGLTRDNSSAENHTTIYSISESPRNGKVIWVGTDDGNLQVTRDGGGRWTNVAPNVPGLPKGTWVSAVEAGRFEEGTAFATFDGHQVGDMKTWVYRTADFGQTWKPLASDALSGYAHVIKQDLENPDLLFLGTEHGLFISVDGGLRWARFTGRFPKVAVRDLAIHPREADLIIATHGRGIYILDDITPLRKLTGEALAGDVTMLPSRQAAMAIPASVQGFPGDDEFFAFNPEEAASITYYLKKRHLFGDLKIEVYDAKGQLVSTLPAGKRRGINRVSWPMRLPPPKLPPANSLVVGSQYTMVGPRVPPGTYTVKLIQDDKSYPSQVELVPDARSSHSAEDRAVQYETAMTLYGMLGRLTYLADTVKALGDSGKQRAEGLPKGDRLRRQLTTLGDTLETFRATLVATGPGGWLSGEEQLREKMATIYGGVNGYDGRPTKSQIDQVKVLGDRLAKAEARLAALQGGEVAAVNRELEKRKLEPLKAKSREEWEKEAGKRTAALPAFLPFSMLPLNVSAAD